MLTSWLTSMALQTPYQNPSEERLGDDLSRLAEGFLGDQRQQDLGSHAEPFASVEANFGRRTLRPGTMVRPLAGAGQRQGDPDDAAQEPRFGQARKQRCG